MTQGKRPIIRGERHHWWPRALSRHWIDSDGLISRIEASGAVTRSTPTKTARISDAHNLLLDSPWNSTFEDWFDQPDNALPRLVGLFEAMVARHRGAGKKSWEFYSQDYAEPDLHVLVGSLVSLLVRSPRFRQETVGAIDSPDSSATGSQALIGLNQRQTYVALMRHEKVPGKVVALWSREQEFIYGDGFYSNLGVGAPGLWNARILVPLTPKIAILYAVPLQCSSDQRMFTLEGDQEMIALVNATTQIYSKNYLFFRNDRPTLSEHFLRREHLEYAAPDPIEDLVYRVPGVVDRRGTTLTDNLGGWPN